MSNQQRPEINIEAEEINALIHSYLVESGWLRVILDAVYYLRHNLENI